MPGWATDDPPPGHPRGPVMPIGPRGRLANLTPDERSSVRNRIGANTWIWVSPPTDAALDELIPKVAEYGFGYVEIPIEHIGDWDPQRVGALARDHGLGITT